MKFNTNLINNIVYMMNNHSRDLETALDNIQEHKDYRAWLAFSIYSKEMSIYNKKKITFVIKKDGTVEIITFSGNRTFEEFQSLIQESFNDATAILIGLIKEVITQQVESVAKVLETGYDPAISDRIPASTWINNETNSKDDINFITNTGGKFMGAILDITTLYLCLTLTVNTHKKTVCGTLAGYSYECAYTDGIDLDSELESLFNNK
jgi:hypothetical protein